MSSLQLIEEDPTAVDFCQARGYSRIANFGNFGNFGKYIGNPLAVFFEKQL